MREHTESIMQHTYTDTTDGRIKFAEDITRHVAHAFRHGSIQGVPMGQSVCAAQFAFAKHAHMERDDAVYDLLSFIDELDMQLAGYGVRVSRSDAVHQVSHGILGDIIKIEIARAL